MRTRLCQRFTKRLEVTFSSGESKYTGISSDLSTGGLFIRTQHGLTPGSLVDIEVYLPEGKTGILKGIVRRTVKTPLTAVKNGMGIELIERDSHYLEFLKNFDTDDKPQDIGRQSQSAGVRGHEADEKKAEKTARHVPETVIIPCQNCNVKNKVPKDRLQFSPKCGKCSTLLDTRDYA
jgi:hypothetical protein